MCSNLPEADTFAAGTASSERVLVALGVLLARTTHLLEGPDVVLAWLMFLLAAISVHLA